MSCQVAAQAETRALGRLGPHPVTRPCAWDAQGVPPPRVAGGACRHWPHYLGTERVSGDRSGADMADRCGFAPGRAGRDERPSMCARVHCASGLRPKEYQQELERLRVATSGRQPAGPPESSELRFLRAQGAALFPSKAPGRGSVFLSGGFSVSASRHVKCR